MSAAGRFSSNRIYQCVAPYRGIFFHTYRLIITERDLFVSTNNLFLCKLFRDISSSHYALYVLYLCKNRVN